MDKRLGIYVSDGVEVVGFTAPLGVFAVAKGMEYERQWVMMKTDRLVVA